jgi:hypothetical protein
MPVTPIVTCEYCKQRCDGKSLGRYPQEQYYKFGEDLEVKMINLIQSKAKGLLTCQKSANWGEAHSKPDLELKSIGQKSKIIARLEVKHITRAFMLVEKRLKSPLAPWETIGVNTAKIRRYAKLYEKEGIPVYLVWRIDRTCFPGRFFYQDIQTLIDIINHYGAKREFVREGEDGDKIAFHYSVNELKPFYVDDYLKLLSTSLETNTLLDTANQEEQLTRDDYGYPEYEFTDADAPPEFGY